MTPDYTFCGQAKITMFSYIEKILTTFDKSDLKGKVTKSREFTNNIFVVKKCVVPAPDGTIYLVDINSTR